MKIFRSTDRLEVKIDDVTVFLAPLTFEQKSEVHGLMLKASEGDTQAGLLGARLAVKYAVKDIKGVEDYEGNTYKLDLKDNVLSEECLQDLVNSEISEKLQITSCTLLTGIPTKILDPITNLPIEGVKIIKNSKRVQKKK